jgi:hypothetical protein
MALGAHHEICEAEETAGNGQETQEKGTHCR